MLRRIVSLGIALVLATAVSAAAGEVRGSWTARVEKDHPGKLYFSLEYDGHSQHGSRYDRTAFTGLSDVDVQSSVRVPAQFRLEREAGTIRFDGTFRDGRGSGDFTFAPNPDYAKRLRSLGLDLRTMRGDADRDQLQLALVDLTLDFVRSMQAAGYDEPLDKYVAFRIFDVNPAYVRDMAAVGFDHLSADKLIETRIHGATPDYIRKEQATGYKLSLDDHIQSRIFNLSPAFAAELGRAGYPDLDRDMLMQFRIHGVTPQFIAELGDLGYSRVPAQKLVEMRIFGVTPEFIQRANKAAHRKLSVHKLVEMRIFHVAPEMAGAPVDDD
jgi:hypothetical protein